MNQYRCNQHPTAVAAVALMVTVTVLVGVVTAKDDANKLCILPLGDSLTQGVGKYGSYREVLDDLLRQRLLESGHNVAVQFGGSLSWPCTPKKPETPYKKGEGSLPHGLPHEGHCNWASGKLATEYPRLAAEQKAQSAVVFSEVGSTSSCWPPNVVLLLIGHNDIFQISKLCKIKEGTAKLSEAAAKCARNHLQLGFVTSHNRLIRFLQEEYRNATKTATTRRTSKQSILLGLNPTTGFPALEQLLHEYINAASVKYGLLTVSFPGWRTGVHTFDTTHPNRDGCMLMAKAWLEGMVKAVPLLSTKLGSGNDDGNGSEQEADSLQKERHEPEAAKAGAVSSSPQQPAESHHEENSGHPIAAAIDWLEYLPVLICLAVIAARVVIGNRRKVKN